MMPSLRQRIVNWLAPATETRASFYTPTVSGWGPSVSGQIVDPLLCENLATVVACVNAIASGLASLPAYVYQRQGDARVEAPNHPVSRLIRQPNRWQSWADLMETLLGSTLLWGNGLAVIEYDGAGRPVSLIPVPWQSVQVTLLPSGDLAYDVVSYQSPFGGVGTPRRYLQDEVLHLKDRADNPYVGRSRVSRAPAVLNAALGLQDYSAAIWRNAATPSGVVETPPNITPEGMRRMEAWWLDKYSGSANGKRVLFADPGVKFTPVSVSPEDAEVLASRSFTVAEICRLFQVPPPLVQDYSHNTFTNSAQAALWFAQFSLGPWARKFELEAARSLFGTAGNFALEIDLSGLMRGDFATRWTANVAAVQAGILRPDEVREAEGYGPLPAPSVAATAAPAMPGMDMAAGGSGGDPVVPGDGGE